MLTDYYFWFAQPATFLNQLDKAFSYFFAALLIAAFMLWVLNLFIKHPVVKKLLRKLMYKDLTVGLMGLFWVGVRYENTPMLAKRFWIILILLVFVVWLLFILKYFIFDFFKEKKTYDDNLLKSRYMPGNKTR